MKELTLEEKVILGQIQQLAAHASSDADTMRGLLDRYARGLHPEPSVHLKIARVITSPDFEVTEYKPFKPVTSCVRDLGPEPVAYVVITPDAVPAAHASSEATESRLRELKADLERLLKKIDAKWRSAEGDSVAIADGVSRTDTGEKRTRENLGAPAGRQAKKSGKRR